MGSNKIVVEPFRIEIKRGKIVMGVYAVKQLIIMRKDLGMHKGKLAAQASHASLGAFLKTTYNVQDENGNITAKGIPLSGIVNEWLSGSFAKVVLAVHSEEELKSCYDLAVEKGFPAAYIVDNGTTVFHNVKTPTCVGIGPCRSEDLDACFSNLKLF
jgi:PTH2 family peptidyl-tRNA hydrolase